MRIAPYDAFADEYYSADHKTSRNFDHATVVALAASRPRIPIDGLVLDVGAGRGRCNEYLGIDTNRVVQLDSSAKMLEVKPRESALLRVLHSADSLPFVDEQFSCVTAFLCDPYLGLNFLAEAYRVLQRGGILIATTPSAEWGQALRSELEIDMFSTRFLTKKGKIVVPSVLVPIVRLREMVKRVGFNAEDTELSSHKLPRSATPISEDIARPAKLMGRHPNELEILYLVIAKK